MPWRESTPGYFTYTGKLADWMKEIQRWSAADLGPDHDSHKFGVYLTALTLGALARAKDKWRQEWLGKGKAKHADSLLERSKQGLSARHVFEVLDYLSEHLELSTMQVWGGDLRAEAAGTAHRLVGEYVRLIILFAAPDTMATCVPPGWWTDGEPALVANGVGLLRHAQCKPPANTSERPLSALELIARLFVWPPSDQLARLAPPDWVLIGLPASGFRLPVSRDDVSAFALLLLQHEGMASNELMQLQVYHQESAPAGTSPAYLVIAGRLNDVPATVDTTRWSGR